jgi:CxxC-x17-CxxC domain-containing protein
MTDRTLTCRDCGREFVFTSGEQDFYTQRGFSEPQRCPECRQARKTQRGATGASGGYSGGGNSGGSYGGNSGGYGGGSNYGGNSGGYDDGAPRAPRQLYAATCSECGQATEVPFSPTPGKPVYCRDCFQNRKSTPRYNTW